MATSSTANLNSLLAGRKVTIVHIGWPTRFRLEDGSVLEFQGIRDEMQIVLEREDEEIWHADWGVE